MTREKEPGAGRGRTRHVVIGSGEDLAEAVRRAVEEDASAEAEAFDAREGLRREGARRLRAPLLLLLAGAVALSVAAAMLSRRYGGGWLGDGWAGSVFVGMLVFPLCLLLVGRIVNRLEGRLPF